MRRGCLRRSCATRGRSEREAFVEAGSTRAGMAIIGTDSLLVYLARWKDESRLLDAVILEVGETDPATLGRIQILASIPDLPQTLLVASAETIHLLDSVRKLMDVIARKKGLVLTLRVAPETPDSFIGDALRLRQVIVNLFIANGVTAFFAFTTL